MFPNGPATNTNHRNSEGTYAYIASALHNIDLGETLDLGLAMTIKNASGE